MEMLLEEKCILLHFLHALSSDLMLLWTYISENDNCAVLYSPQLLKTKRAAEINFDTTRQRFINDKTNKILCRIVTNCLHSTTKLDSCLGSWLHMLEIILINLIKSLWIQVYPRQKGKIMICFCTSDLLFPPFFYHP